MRYVVLLEDDQNNCGYVKNRFLEKEGYLAGALGTLQTVDHPEDARTFNWLEALVCVAYYTVSFEWWIMASMKPAPQKNSNPNL